MINIATADYSKLKTEYLRGNISYRELAKKYNVSFSTLRKVAAKEQWTQLRNNAGAKRDTVLAEKIGEQSAKIDDKYFRLVDKLFDKAEEVIDNTPIWQPTSLKEMATTMKYLKECKGVKSEADMREQEARIAKLQKEAQEEDNSTTEIKVTFGTDDGEDTSKWAE